MNNFFVKRGKLAKENVHISYVLLDFESHSRYMDNVFASSQNVTFFLESVFNQMEQRKNSS